MKTMLPNKKGVVLEVPRFYLQKSGLAGNSELGAHILKQALVFLPNQMTALESIQAMTSLMDLWFELFAHLVREWYPCEDCYSDGHCEIKEMIVRPKFDISAKNSKMLDHRENLKLHFEVDEKDKSIKICVKEKNNEPGVCDVPAWLQVVFNTMGLCLADLDDLIRDGEIVYGE